MRKHLWDLQATIHPHIHISILYTQTNNPLKRRGQGQGECWGVLVSHGLRQRGADSKREGRCCPVSMSFGFNLCCPPLEDWSSRSRVCLRGGRELRSWAILLPHSHWSNFVWDLNLSQQKRTHAGSDSTDIFSLSMLNCWSGFTKVDP